MFTPKIKLSYHIHTIFGVQFNKSNRDSWLTTDSTAFKNVDFVHDQYLSLDDVGQ